MAEIGDVKGVQPAVGSFGNWSRAIQKLISSEKPAIDKHRSSVSSGISSESIAITAFRGDFGVQILLLNNLSVGSGA
jgi:hypothetical protein